MTDEDKKEHHGEKELAPSSGPAPSAGPTRPTATTTAARARRARSVRPTKACIACRPRPTDVRPTKDLEWFFDCLEGSVRKCPGGDGCKKTLSLAAILVHLNDDHQWSREQIAAWLDNLK